MHTHLTFRHHRFTSTLLGTLLVLIACAAATAQERDRPRFKDEPSAQSAEPSAAAPADAPNARLVALVRAGGAVVLQKGVRSVRRIATGVYCIRPEAATGIDPQTAVAVVSIEYFYSLFNEVQVQWARRGHGCGSNRLAVYTLADRNLDARYTFSNAAGFVIYVP